MLWILVQKEPLCILTSWCSCMAGTSQSCNHVIAVLYKIDCALQKGLLNPSCTSTSCSWNKSTKCDIEPKKIKDIVIWKKIRSRSNIKELNTYKEKERSEELQKFNPVLKSFQKLKDEVLKFYNKLHDVSLQSAVLLCINSEEETVLEAFSLENIASKIDNISKNLTEDEQITKFLESLPLSRKSSEILKIKTRGQSDNDLWSAVRKGCLYNCFKPSWHFHQDELGNKNNRFYQTKNYSFDK